MCGIVGYFKPEVRLQASQATMDLTLATLRRRGPDATGYYTDDHVFLGHTRLSIIDISSGDQPIYNEDRSKCIVFNGEIFNFKD